MDEKGLTKRLHQFERKVYLGVTGLAGAGAVAVVSKWQSAWAGMDDARSQFGELTGSEDVTNSVYTNINNALANLSDAVATGSKEVVHEAGVNFYHVLADNHARLYELLDNVRGSEGGNNPTVQATVKVTALLGNALGVH